MRHFISREKYTWIFDPCAAIFDMCGGRSWLEGELSRAPEARARKLWRFWVDTFQNVCQTWPKCPASLYFSFTSKFIFHGGFFLLHLNFTLKFIFLKTLCFTSLWNFFSKIGHFPCFTFCFTSAPPPLLSQLSKLLQKRGFMCCILPIPMQVT